MRRFLILGVIFYSAFGFCSGTPDCKSTLVRASGLVQLEYFLPPTEYSGEFLGEGSFGRVFRVTERAGKSYIVKEYKLEVDNTAFLAGALPTSLFLPSTHQIPSQQREIDFALMRFLEAAQADLLPSFARIAHVERTDHPQVLLMEDIRGRTLHEILMDQSVSEIRKLLLKGRYQELVDRIKTDPADILGICDFGESIEPARRGYPFRATKQLSPHPKHLLLGTIRFSSRGIILLFRSTPTTSSL